VPKPQNSLTGEVVGGERPGVALANGKRASAGASVGMSLDLLSAVAFLWKCDRSRHVAPLQGVTGETSLHALGRCRSG